jgi:hypothetical protein
MTATNYDRYSRWARIGVWLAILTLLVFIASIVHAAVATTEAQTVTLLRGGSTLATATSWEDCRAKALADAAKSTATTGTVTYTCQSEKRKVIATYSVTPPPIDPPPVVDPPPSTGTPLGQNDVVVKPTSARYWVRMTESDTGHAYSKSIDTVPFFKDVNGNQYWVTPALFSAYNGGFKNLTVWANGIDDFGAYGTWGTNGVYGYPSAIWCWRAGEGTQQSTPCANKRTSEYTKLESLWRWKGPGGPNAGKDKVVTLIDAYWGPKPNPSGGDKNISTNIFAASYIDGGDSAGDGNFSYWGTWYGRAKPLSGTPYKYAICKPSDGCGWSDVATVLLFVGPSNGSNNYMAGTKNLRIDWIKTVKALEDAGAMAKGLYVWSFQYGWEMSTGGAYSGSVCQAIDGQPSC